MQGALERHHWVNTLVGVLDAAFSLREEEQFFAASIITGLLDRLDVPDRAPVAELPAALAMECSAGFFSTQLAAGSGLRGPRANGRGDLVVAMEDWRDSLTRMLFRAYPGFSPTERVDAVATIDALLLGLGVPDRRASHLPEDVIATHREAR